jgi:hypothetical protein
MCFNMSLVPIKERLPSGNETLMIWMYSIYGRYRVTRWPLVVDDDRSCFLGFIGIMNMCMFFIFGTRIR